MQYWIGFVFVLALGVVGLAVSVGCGNSCTAAGCTDGVEVELVPEVEVTYDIDLVLDGQAEAFTCVRSYDDLIEEWVWRSQPPDGMDCDSNRFRRYFGFGTGNVPASVEIAVSAEDGSWSGSLTTNPSYEVLQPNGPDCTPTCRFARLTMTNDSTAFEVQP